MGKKLTTKPVLFGTDLIKMWLVNLFITSIIIQDCFSPHPSTSDEQRTKKERKSERETGRERDRDRESTVYVWVCVCVCVRERDSVEKDRL